MKKIYNWFVYSSQNPEKISRTIKAGLLAVTPAIAFILAITMGVEISQDSLILAIGQLTEFIGLFLTAVFAGLKVINTITSMFGIDKNI